MLIFQEEKKSNFYTMKRRSKKTEKNGFFPKVLVHGFVKKIDVFHVFVFGKIGKKNGFGDILERKKTFLDYKSKE